MGLPTEFEALSVAKLTDKPLLSGLVEGEQFMRVHVAGWELGGDGIHQVQIRNYHIVLWYLLIHAHRLLIPVLAFVDWTIDSAVFFEANFQAFSAECMTTLE